MKESNLRGYTLVEMAVVMAVVATLTAVALPAFRSTLEAQRTRAALHAVSAQFALARTTAITRRESVSVCPSAGGGGCTGDFDWSRGWIMYRDPGRSDQPETPDAILRHENAPVGPSMRLLSSTGRRVIRFLPDGRSAGSNLRVRVCHQERLLGEVVVNNLGRVRSRRTPGTQSC